MKKLQLEMSRAKGGGSGSSGLAPAAAGTGRTQEVKVRHIVTREVSTDEANFKDVVQRLTGKDSAAARAEVVAAGRSSQSNVAVEGGGGAGVSEGVVLFEDTVAGVLPSSAEMKRW